MSMIPKASEVAREALIVLAGTIIAAAVVSQFPRLRAWLREAWDKP